MASSIPLYRRIKARICEDLGAAVRDGAPVRIPPERELQTRYGVSRPTIAKALAELVEDGLAFRSPGSGSFLLPSTPSPAGEPRIGFVAAFPGHELPLRCLRGVERAARRRDYRVLISNAGTCPAEEEAAVRDLMAAGVRGLVIYPICRGTADLDSDYLSRADLGVPLVLVDLCLPGYPHPKVVFDNWRAAHALTTWLVERGHRRIAFLSYSERRAHATLAPRIDGYRDALYDAGIDYEPDRVAEYHPERPDSELEAILDNWTQQEHPTAILAADDRAAMECIRRLERRGFAIPGDVEVTGWDHREPARHFHPAFPTTHPDFERMGEIACDLLLRSFRRPLPPGTTHVLDVPLVLERAPSLQEALPTVLADA